MLAESAVVLTPMELTWRLADVAIPPAVPVTLILQVPEAPVPVSVGAYEL